MFYYAKVLQARANISVTHKIRLDSNYFRILELWYCAVSEGQPRSRRSLFSLHVLKCFALWPLCSGPTFYFCNYRSCMLQNNKCFCCYINVSHRSFALHFMHSTLCPLTFLWFLFMFSASLYFYIYLLLNMLLSVQMDNISSPKVFLVFQLLPLWVMSGCLNL